MACFNFIHPFKVSDYSSLSKVSVNALHQPLRKQVSYTLVFKMSILDTVCMFTDRTALGRMLKYCSTYQSVYLHCDRKKKFVLIISSHIYRVQFQLYVDKTSVFVFFFHVFFLLYVLFTKQSFTHGSMYILTTHRMTQCCCFFVRIAQKMSEMDSISKTNIKYVDINCVQCCGIMQCYLTIDICPWRTDRLPRARCIDLHNNPKKTHEGSF